MYNQRDPRWGELKINGTSSRMKDYGCFITSLAWLAGIKPDEALERLEKGDGFDHKNKDWISSVRAAEALGLEYFPPRRSADLDASYTHIAEVDFSPSPGKQQHFVVYEPDGTQLDPWTGGEGTYPVVTKRLFRNNGIEEEGDIYVETIEAIAGTIDYDYGTKLNKNEAKEYKEKIHLLVSDNEELIDIGQEQLETIKLQKKENELMQETIDELESAIKRPKYSWRIKPYTIKVWKDDSL